MKLLMVKNQNEVINMAGKDKLVFNPGETNIPFDLNEGDMTYEADNELEFGTGSSWNFTERLRKGDKVILDTNNDGTVKKAPAGAKEWLGQIISTPEWPGPRPTENKPNGTYERRRATVQVMASHITTEKLEANNTAVGVGDSVVPGTSTPNTIDKATDVNNTRALTSAVVNSGDRVVVAYGFYGKLKD